MSWRRSRGRLRWEVEQEALAAVRAEARRRAMVRARQFVGFAAVVAVTLPPGRR
jgi:hypothetical protein